MTASTMTPCRGKMSRRSPLPGRIARLLASHRAALERIEELGQARREIAGADVTDCGQPRGAHEDDCPTAIALNALREVPRG